MGHEAIPYITSNNPRADRVYNLMIKPEGSSNYIEVNVEGYDYGTDVMQTVKDKYGEGTEFSKLNPFDFVDINDFKDSKHASEELCAEALQNDHDRTDLGYHDKTRYVAYESKDGNKIQISSLHAYDDAEYYWASSRDGGKTYSIIRAGKKIKDYQADPDFEYNDVVGELVDLNRSVKPVMMYEAVEHRSAEEKMAYKWLRSQVMDVCDDLWEEGYEIPGDYADDNFQMTRDAVDVGIDDPVEVAESLLQYLKNQIGKCSFDQMDWLKERYEDLRLTLKQYFDISGDDRALQDTDRNFPKITEDVGEPEVNEEEEFVKKTIREYSPRSEYLGKEDEYRDYGIYRYRNGWGHEYLFVVTSKKWGEWPEFDAEDEDYVAEWIDKYIDEGEKAADDYWFERYRKFPCENTNENIEKDHVSMNNASTKMSAKERFKALDDFVDEAVELPQTVYSVSYVVDDGPYQAIMVKANSEEEAIAKLKKSNPRANVIAAGIEYDPEEMRKRGKPLLEELSDNVNVHDWYVRAFPYDELGMELNPETTFTDLNNALEEGEPDVYEVLGVADSIVRERLFDKLSELTGVSYDDIFEKWVNSGASKDENVIWTDAERYQDEE